MATNDLAMAEAQWREQFAAMKAALAGLKLPQQDKLVGDDMDEDYDDFEGYSSGSGGQDVWDFISDDGDDDYSSDFVELEHLDSAGGSGQGVDWFTNKCADIAVRNGLSADVFRSQIVSILSSGRPEGEIQAELTDLVGFDDLDFIIETLARKDQVVAAAAAPRDDSEPTGRRLLTRAEREEALRRQDQEHKSTSLAPSYSREPQYPHVYKSYSAGNTLSYTGKKYGLPPGSETLQREKYEECFIPAGPKGVLGPGQTLINISALDGLCQNTFKGYKALNRMQSLVYPVAYKTNENMLICAPTGAVSSRFKPKYVHNADNPG